LYFGYLVAIVIGCSIFLFLFIWILILSFTQKITSPINKLTELTEEIKKATGRDSRDDVLSKIENDQIFAETKK
jgi:nitrogen fixation/metabolism regulation signal transduction histidine kinase